jgi:hypothetical protein
MGEMTHIYAGPTTVWGLEHGSLCRIVGRRAGGIRIQTVNGRCWLIGPGEIERRPRHTSVRERLRAFARAHATA